MHFWRRRRILKLRDFIRLGWRRKLKRERRRRSWDSSRLLKPRSAKEKRQKDNGSWRSTMKEKRTFAPRWKSWRMRKPTEGGTLWLMWSKIQLDTSISSKERSGRLVSPMLKPWSWLSNCLPHRQSHSFQEGPTKLIWRSRRWSTKCRSPFL